METTRRGFFGLLGVGLGWLTLHRRLTVTSRPVATPVEGFPMWWSDRHHLCRYVKAGSHGWTKGTLVWTGEKHDRIFGIAMGDVDPHHYGFLQIASIRPDARRV